MDYSQLGNKKRKRSPHATRVRNKISLLTLRVALAVVLIGGFALLGAGLGLYIGILNASPEFCIDDLFAGGTLDRTSVIVNAHTGEVMERLHAGQNHEFTPLSQIPLHLQHAFIAIEDERFFEHNGIDIRSIGRAIYTIITTSGARTEGASTITQQFIKNVQRRFDSDIITKLQEQYLAVNLERNLTAYFTAQGHENPRLVAKEFILEAYLNLVSLGRQNYGVQAAAMFYYGVDVSQLTIAQSATIAAITQNPTWFPPDTRPQNNWGRAYRVLENMLRLGFITEEEFEEATQEVELECGAMLGAVYNTIVRGAGGGARTIMAQFDCFTDAMLDQVRADLIAEFSITGDMADTWIFQRGLTIISNQEPELQAIVDRAFLDESMWPGAGSGFTIDVDYEMMVINHVTGERRRYRELITVNTLEEAEAFIENLHETLLSANCEIESYRQFFLPQPQGAFVLMDHHTGHVLALRGIRGPKEGNRVFNRATHSTRQPGSQLKPLAFAAAFDLGIMQPSTVIDDIPFTWIDPAGNPWSPGNHWGSTFRGLQTARYAIYMSANVISARAVADTTIPHLTVPAFLAYLENMGISTIHPNDGPATVLGGMTRGVHLIELTGAYAAVANMGEFNRPMLYYRVLDYYGNVLLENREGPRRVLSRNAAYLTINSMKDTLTRGTGGRANWESTQLRRDIPIAGKTGTTQRNADLGFAGSTPYFTAAIWLGNDSNQPMTRRSGVVYHTPMWRYIMEEIHRDLPPRQFERPETIRTASVCLDSGHLATDLCRQDPRGSRARQEVFAAGLVPTQECRVHQQFTYCTVHGLMAGHFCPPDTITTRVGLVRARSIDHIEDPVRDRVYEVPIGVRQGLVCDYHTELQFHWYDPWGGNDPWHQDPTDWVSPFPPDVWQQPQQPPYQPPHDQPPQDLPPQEPEPTPPPDDPPEDVPEGHDSSWVAGGTS